MANKKKWAAIGAGIGMFGGPLGAMAGGAIGAALAALDEKEGKANDKAETEIPWYFNDNPLAEGRQIMLTKEGVWLPLYDLRIPWSQITAVEKIPCEGDDRTMLCEDLLYGIVLRQGLIVGSFMSINDDRNPKKKPYAQDLHFPGFKKVTLAKDYEKFEDFRNAVLTSDNPVDVLRAEWEKCKFTLDLFSKLPLKPEGLYTPFIWSDPCISASFFFEFAEMLQDENLPDGTLAKLNDFIRGREIKQAAYQWLNYLPDDQENWKIIANVELMGRLFSLPEVDSFQEALTRYSNMLDYDLIFENDILDMDEQTARLSWLQGLGDKAQARDRKYIVCSNEPRNPKLCLKRTAGVMVLLAEDIDAYNSGLENAESRLIFQPGHPQNGQTYVQHPMRTNIYYDVDSFHAALLENKHSELMYLLQCLGAKTVKLSVTDSVEQTSRHARSQSQGAGYSKGVVGIDGSISSSESSDEATSVYQKLSEDAEFIPRGEPYIPKDLAFYAHEEKWQRMAQAAVARRYQCTKVSLEYRQDYAITQKRLLDVQASIKLVLPSYSMNLKKDFESEMRRIASTIWDYEVVFEDGEPTHKQESLRTDEIERDEDKSHAIRQLSDVLKARPASVNTPTMVDQPQKLSTPHSHTSTPLDSTLPSTGLSREEALFFKRAHRYVTNDGDLDEKERADLVSLAQKLGIDELRAEELIEEAFGQ